MRKFVWKITRVTNKTSQICQYRVCPPVASMQATQRRRILLISLAICSWGILLHSSCKAAPKAWSVLGRGTLCHTRWPRMGHARLATSQEIEQANRDDPHCSAAGTAVLSSPDEVLRCHPENKRPKCHTLSKALLISQKTALSSLPSSSALQNVL